MASNITLSAGVRQNLLALQNTASLLGTTQNRLATGKKVNSALDNPTNFFTSSALSSRASDLGKLLDSMANGINTVKAADNGLTAITTTVESLKATVTQARLLEKLVVLHRPHLSCRHRRYFDLGRRGDRFGQRRCGELTGGPHVGLQLREHGLQQRRQHLRWIAHVHRCR
jgi:hypothetical protein